MSETASRSTKVDFGRFAEGDVACPCGKTVHLYYNGGELDQRKCVCGREFWTEHRSTVLMMREPAVITSALTARVEQAELEVRETRNGYDRLVGDAMKAERRGAEKALRNLGARYAWAEGDDFYDRLRFILTVRADDIKHGGDL